MLSHVDFIWLKNLQKSFSLYFLQISVDLIILTLWKRNEIFPSFWIAIFSLISASPSQTRLEKRLHPVSLFSLISFRHWALIKCWRTTCLSYFQQLSSTPSETYNPVVIYLKKKSIYEVHHLFILWLAMTRYYGLESCGHREGGRRFRKQEGMIVANTQKPC